MKLTSRIRFPFQKEVRPLEDYQGIGRRWKCGNAWSLTILIGRGLDFKTETKRLKKTKRLFRNCAVVKVR